MTDYTADVFEQLLEGLDGFGLANDGARLTHSFKQLNNVHDIASFFQ